MYERRHDYSHDEAHQHDHHQDRHEGAHGHSHGPVDPGLLDSEQGIWAVKISLVGLGITALVQLAIAYLSGSIGLMADTIHNFGDAGTALPLWAAFALSNRGPSRWFTYGYGRVEDLAGLAVVLTILASAGVAGWESIQRLLHPQAVDHLWAVALGALVGFLGNEGVAVFRIRVGKKIESAALVADGYHARADGFASLAVLLGVAGLWLGFPLADPIVGLLITVLILRIVWDSARTVFGRLIDGVNPEILNEITRAVGDTDGVEEVTEVRARWLGHRLHAEVNLAVDPRLSVEEGHAIATEARHNLLHEMKHLSDATIHVDPSTASGEQHHRIDGHVHDSLPPHSHT